MVTLGIGILTKDNPDMLLMNLAFHVPYLKSINMPLYVFDNSEHTDNSQIMKNFPDVKYHKHEKSISYDEAFKYAVENIKEDYVWVLGDKIKVCIGTIPFVFDFIQRQPFAALLVGFGMRLAMLGESYVETDRNKLMRTVAWHTTLCGSAIYKRELISIVDKTKYMGYGFMHLAILFDGLTKMGNPVAVITHGLIKYFGDSTPTWLPNTIKIWSQDLLDVIRLLPDHYREKEKTLLVKNNGFNGNLLSEQQFMVLASMGYFNMEILKKYKKYILQACMVPYKRLKEIARTFKE